MYIFYIKVCSFVTLMIITPDQNMTYASRKSHSGLYMYDEIESILQKTPDVTLLTKLSDFFSKGVEKYIFTIKMILMF